MNPHITKSFWIKTAWIIGLPISSLLIVYGIFLIIAQNITTQLYWTLVIIAFNLPVLALSIGILQAYKLKKWFWVPTAAAISSLLWIILAVIMSHFYPDSTLELSFSKTFTTFLIYIVFITVILTLFRVIMQTFRIIGRKKQE